MSESKGEPRVLFQQANKPADGSISMGELVSDTHAIKAACIQCTVNILGMLAIVILYYNYILLQPYFSALFWATLTSIPLHKLKRALLRLILEGTGQKRRPGMLRVLLGLMHVALKFLLGGAWRGLMLVPTYYFAQVDRFRYEHAAERHAALAHESRSDGQGGRAKAADAKPLSRDQGKDQQGAQLAAHEAEVELEEALRDGMCASPSGAYFVVLFRACGFYIFYLMGCSLTLDHWILLVGLLLSTATLHVGHVLFRSLYRIYVEDAVARCAARLCCAVKSAACTLDRATWGLAKRLYERVVSSSSRMGKDMKLETLKQINSIAASLILAIFIAATLLLSFFVAFQIAHEASIFFDRSIVFFNDSVIHNERLKDFQLKDQLKATFDEAAGKGAAWADVQLKEKFPGQNLSVQLLYDKAYQSYHWLFASPANGTGSANATLSTDRLAKLFATHFPIGGRVLRDLKGGRLSALLRLSDLRQAMEELRRAAIKAAQALFHYDKEYVESTIEWLERNMIGLGQAFLSHASVAFSYLSIGLLGLLNFLFYGFNILAQLLLFFVTLYYLLLPEKDPLDHLSSLIQTVDQRQVVRSSIEKAVNAVFMTTVKMFVFHSLFTWLTFNIFDIQFIYMGAFAAGVIAIIPIASPLWVVLPACVELYLKGQTAAAFVLVALHLVASWFVDPAIYRDIPGSHPYFSGLSIVLGLWAFGWQGIVVGPLLACLPVIAFHLYKEMLFSP